MYVQSSFVLTMKKSDIITILIALLIIGGFAFIPGAWDWFNETTKNHGLIMSFFKFAILGTFGEMLSLRIKKGVYLEKGFGLAPKMLVWGVLGVVIASAMTIFKSGTIVLLQGGFKISKAALWFAGGLSWGKVFVALSISVLMNTLFAPVFMTFHKITDIHIAETGGSLKRFFSGDHVEKNQLGHTVRLRIQKDPAFVLVSRTHHNIPVTRHLPSVVRSYARRCPWRDIKY